MRIEKHLDPETNVSIEPQYNFQTQSDYPQETPRQTPQSADDLDFEANKFRDSLNVLKSEY